MNITILGPAHPFRGGLAIYNERLAEEFINEGHEVNIETFTLQYPKFLFPGKTQFSESKPPINLNIKRTINSVNPFNWFIVGRRIKKEKPDLVIIKYWLPFMAPCFGSISKIIRKNNHTKVICIADNIIPHEKRIGDNLLTGYFINNIDGIVAQSKSVYDDIFHFTNKLPVRLNPHPLFDNFGESINPNQAKIKLGIDPFSRYILFFGFIRDYKGLDWLLKAFADDRMKDMNIKLIVAGEFYTDAKPYLEMIDSLELNDKVILKTDFIPDDEVNLYFSCADLVAQPYKSATQSGVTQIGYHFEKSMLVTNVGGLPEIIPNNIIGYVVEPEIKAISDALFDFFTTDKKNIFEKNIKEEKKRFLWSTMTGTILELSGNK